MDILPSSRRSPAWRLLAVCLPLASPAAGATFDAAQPPGDNYDKAAFRLWHADGLEGSLRGLIVLVPGSNGDGRGQVEDLFWQELAARHDFGLLGVRLTDKPHEDMAIEHYVDVRHGSGETFLAALATLAKRSGRPEVATAPLLLWGMSAGGQLNYEFALWKPERVIGFVVNKGGIYYNAIASPEARAVPGLFLVGEDDIAFRNDIIRGIYSVNRRFGALWALVVEPGLGHEVGRSRDLAAIFFEELIASRLPEDPNGGVALAALDYDAGFLGDPNTMTARPAEGSKPTTYPTAWLPTVRMARAWEAVMAGRPF